MEKNESKTWWKKIGAKGDEKKMGTNRDFYSQELFTKTNLLYVYVDLYV